MLLIDAPLPTTHFPGVLDNWTPRHLLGLIVLVVLVVKQVGEIVLEEDPLLCQLPGEGRCGSVRRGGWAGRRIAGWLTAERELDGEI